MIYKLIEKMVKGFRFMTLDFTKLEYSTETNELIIEDFSSQIKIPVDSRNLKYLEELLRHIKEYKEENEETN